MAKVKFVGRDDLRILDAADLKKAEVEGFRKTEFARFEAVEVSDEVAEALLDESEFFGKFELVEEDEAPAEEPIAEAKKSSRKASTAPGEATANSISPAPAGPNGSSTGA